MSVDDRNAKMKEVLTTMFDTPDPSGGLMEIEPMKLAMEHIFGEVWSRPGLDPKLRSVAVISLLAARGGAEYELRHHLGIGLRNGLTKDEIYELLLHVGTYAGAAALGGSMKLAQDVFATV
jgi:4-carboxymuconolactone decarboxylase